MPFSHSAATEMLIDVDALRPGEFVWHPERQPTGPVSIVVSLVQQRLHVYRNGIRIAVSTVSSSKPGHETPTGVFVILQKDKHHKSSTYNGAPMPNMNRLTWDGIALHAGKLPGYPASHGCVRLPMDFSARLFDLTHLGTPVIIAGTHQDPVELTHPGPVLSGYAEHEMEEIIQHQEARLHPSDWDQTAVQEFATLVLSAADGRGELILNDRIVDSGPVSITGGTPVGEHVYVMRAAEQGGPRTWHAIAHHDLAVLPEANHADIFSRIKMDRDFSRRSARLMHPGSILIVTETGLHPERRSGPDFVILDAQT